MNTQKILNEAGLFRPRISELKKDSHYYPSILIREYPVDHPKYKKEIYASSLIRIKRDGIYYTIHCVEYIRKTGNTTESDLLLKFMVSAYNIMYLHKIGVYDDVDTLQTDEYTRLMNMLHHKR